jgi:hypothetical protein
MAPRVLEPYLMYGESRSGVMTTECAAFHGAFNQSGKSI